MEKDREMSEQVDVTEKDNSNEAGILENVGKQPKIALNDILQFTKDELPKVLLRLCSPPSGDKNNDPLEAFKRNPEEFATGWTLWRFKRNIYSPGQIVVSLCRLKDDPDRWLLVTVKTITKITGAVDGVGYEGDEWEQYRKYYGRVIVRFHRDNRYLKLHGDKSIDKFEVEQILSDVFEDDHFPGYDQISLSYERLKRIIDRHLNDWFNALNNQKGVYVITDTKTGKLYVGSATSDNGMLLGRWTSYVNTLHGGNAELRKLVEEKGEDYVRKYFQYTLLENYNQRESNERILDREKWWKNVLKSREFGYNDN